ncbi:family 43 glycosylhydrolase [Hymenobacter monticola]|uniref:Family 43 glycosylhydrolase n=1 Tax=Hymenobacter monticola TaxID=1705399 RepID=A0ABY4BB48_9BACT|nr:family 43 glycosylhydrolase [Hymenobacter monticola]UOE36396.1 family 43 glycosylhydrolase [Hymenobacter monticola]
MRKPNALLRILKTVGIAVGSLVGLFVVAGLGIYAYLRFTSSPRPPHTEAIAAATVLAPDTTQAVNPYLPAWEYVPDGEPRVFGDRLYVFGSHDRFNANTFCENDYAGWSAPLSNLANWRYEGVSYRRTQDPANPSGSMSMYAPDAQRGPDGRYYLYYQLSRKNAISVAVADAPAGPYQFYGYVTNPDGSLLGDKPQDHNQFDPGIFIDDDKRIYLYTGFCPVDWMKTLLNLGRPVGNGPIVIELEPDMKTVKVPSDGRFLVPDKSAEAGTGFEGHGFFEASSLRKINGRYYFIYSSYNGHELCYAVSNSPTSGFTYGGVLVSNGDIGLPGVSNPTNARNYTGNNHGSLVQVRGKWYVFYHRQTNQHMFSRQGCAEEIQVLPDGRIPQVEMTSQGLNGKPLRDSGVYSAHIACNLYSKEGAVKYDVFMPHVPLERHPYLTQDGPDRTSQPNQYIANMQDGATAGFKYFDFQGANAIAVTTRGPGRGKMLVKDGPQGSVVAEVAIQPSEQTQTFQAPLRIRTGRKPLFFVFQGTGAVEFHKFELAKR